MGEGGKEGEKGGERGEGRGEERSERKDSKQGFNQQQKCVTWRTSHKHSATDHFYHLCSNCYHTSNHCPTNKPGHTPLNHCTIDTQTNTHQVMSPEEVRIRVSSRNRQEER